MLFSENLWPEGITGPVVESAVPTLPTSLAVFPPSFLKEPQASSLSSSFPLSFLKYLSWRKEEKGPQKGLSSRWNHGQGRLEGHQ